VGDRGWRLIWRVSSDEAGAIVINVAEVWAMGARSESEVYQEAHHHVATLPRSPLTVTLTDVIKRLGTIGDDAGQLRAAAKPGSGRRQRGLIRWGATGLGNGDDPAGRRVRSHRSPAVRPGSPPTCAELEGEWSGATSPSVGPAWAAGTGADAALAPACTRASCGSPARPPGPKRWQRGSWPARTGSWRPLPPGKARSGRGPRNRGLLGAAPGPPLAAGRGGSAALRPQVVKAQLAGTALTKKSEAASTKQGLGVAENRPPRVASWDQPGIETEFRAAQ
jgi:hypothetical protein